MDEVIQKWKENMQKVYDMDAEAKAKGELKGRYISEQYADGYAIYQIVKENKASVLIQVVTEIGDDWVIPYWGESTTIPKEYAVNHVARREAMAELFKRKV